MRFTPSVSANAAIILKSIVSKNQKIIPRDLQSLGDDESSSKKAEVTPKEKIVQVS